MVDVGFQTLYIGVKVVCEGWGQSLGVIVNIMITK